MFALEGLHGLGINGEFTVSAKAEQLKRAYRMENDSIAFILEQLLEEDTNASVISKILYSVYQDFCFDNGFKGVMNIHTFGKQLRRIFPDIESRRETIKGKKETVYYGIRFLDSPEAKHISLVS